MRSLGRNTKASCLAGDFPLTERVCGYGSLLDFQNSRKETGQWVFWKEQVELVLSGRYDAITPLHVELSPTYLCNFACSWCSCRSAKDKWVTCDAHDGVVPAPKVIMPWEYIRFYLQWVDSLLKSI